MKRLSLIALALFMSFSGFSRSWWETAVIDACGAGLGGMQGAGFGPVGAGVGALLGGVGTSLAANSVAHPPFDGGTGPYDPGNPFENYGSLHNQICIDFKAAGLDATDTRAVSNFVIQDAQRLGVQLPPWITPTFPTDIIDQMKNVSLRTPDEVYNFMSEYAPDASKDKIHTAINILLNTRNIQEFEEVFPAQQQIVINDPSLTSEQKSVWCLWFAILWYSSHMGWSIPM